MSSELSSSNELYNEIEAKNVYAASLKQTREALVESEEIYRTLYYAFHDPIITVDADKKEITQVNQATVELFRAKNWEGIIGLSPMDISSPKQYNDLPMEDQIDNEINHAIKDGHHRFFWIFRRLDGSTFDAEVSLAKAHIYGKTIIFGSIRDITIQRRYQRRIENLNERLGQNAKIRTSELEHANDELRQMVDYLNTTQDQLVQSEKMASLGGLVAGVAHEINTPIGNGLVGMTWLSELVQRMNKLYREKDLSEEEFTDFLDNVEKVSKSVTVGLKKAADLIKSFKQVAVDQSNEEKRLFFIKDYIDEILLTLNSNFRQKNINVEINIEDGISITSYAGAFSQILTNLILNSLNHGFRGANDGTITIGAKLENESLHLSYADNGHGMTKETIDNIYEPFYTTGREYGGTGLGMHIVYNIVSTRFNGEIEVDSKLGEGVEFSILLQS